MLVRAEEFGLPSVTKARQAIAVRAGDEILGSIWAAVGEPFPPTRERAFVEAAKLVALHLLRVRAGADVERRLRSELVNTVLEGGHTAADAAARLGGIVYAAFPLDRTAGGDAAEQRVAAVLVEYLQRTGGDYLVGIGRTADLHALPRSRQDADRVLRVLRRRHTRGCVARLPEVYAEALLLDVAEADGLNVCGPVSRLVEYDRAHRSNLVDTLSAWLDAFGDVNSAAEAVHVHPNTFRYRLSRIAEVGEVDLADGETRFSMMLQLRLLGD